MICNTPTKLQRCSEGCNTPVQAETTSSSGFFSHRVLTTPLTSFQGSCVPEAEGEPSPVGRSPQSVPIPTPCTGGSGSLGEGSPRSYDCGQDRLSSHMW